MGLAFLNKKGWHTGSFQNIEKVWIAEEKEQERQKKVQELQRRLKEQRHYEDIKKLQVQAGIIPSSHLQRLDWMYEGGAIKNTSSQEYLLGKPVEVSVQNGTAQWRPTLCKQTTANPANELFTKIHEDPLFIIMKQQQKRRQALRANPMKLKQVRKEIEKMRSRKSHKKVKERNYKKYRARKYNQRQ